MRLPSLLLLLLLAGAGAAGWWFFLGRPPLVATAELTRGTAAEVVYASGVVEPVRWAEVTPVRRGRIVERCVCEGHTVEEGEVLFRLDGGELKARLAELQARLDYAESELARAEGLFERRVTTRENYDRAISEVTSLRAMVAAVESQLSELVLTAPMAGMVLRVDGEIGEVAELGTTLAWVGQPKPLRVVAEVNEEDIPRLRVGQPALIAADAFPGRVLEAEVASITPKGDPVLRTYRVYLALPEDTPLFIGMTVDVNVAVREVPDAVLAPAPALIGGTLQVVGPEGLVELRAVETGILGGAHVQILGGAAPGERVVSPARDGLATGDRVRLR